MNSLYMCMYVCIHVCMYRCVCEGARLGLGGCGRMKGTSLRRRQSKRVASLGRRQGDEPEAIPYTVRSNQNQIDVFICFLL
ncbi:hypothetical protein Hanom_Chr10g00896211 [Helianthus anomalus]